MQKFIALFAGLMLAFTAHAAQFKEGEHYTVVNNPKSSTSKVTEFFSFYCPHCYKFEAIVENLKPALPQETRFEKVHVGFMGGNMALPMAKAYATMVALEVEQTMVPVMFRQIHDLGQAPRDEQDLRQIFIDHGVAADQYDSAYNSFVVNSMQRKFDKEFKKSTLTGVPGVLVNNKYLVTGKGIKTYDDYNRLVNYLLTL
ncbi:thiol:disulfide interchange protein DsbA/DsbL [Vibrio sonorensis]|uniref:thiol:disulfide interchange protein DsbA/DsbL n=1 Tax=Vibrio sonorensis TaxID=1004316 RepID=UPI0008DAA9CC|nr:thiol:disulfide interchange protein DsbA/DsbL [Vibrio sonorensis]